LDEFERFVQDGRIASVELDVIGRTLHGWHLPLDAAFEREAANMHPVMQSESTRRGVEDFQQGKRFWFT